MDEYLFLTRYRTRATPLVFVPFIGLFLFAGKLVAELLVLAVKMLALTAIVVVALYRRASDVETPVAETFHQLRPAWLRP